MNFRGLGDEERGKMARSIETWINERVRYFSDSGEPGDQQFRRCMELVKARGGKPVYAYMIN